MEPVVYDFSDHRIQAMVCQNHVPEEPEYARTGGGTFRTGDIVLCRHDYEPWPCSTIKTLESWVKQQTEKMLQGNNEE